MPAPYTKPHLDLPAQVRLLASRGLVVPDPLHAERVLQAVGYYRLSGYWYPYRQPSPTGVGREWRPPEWCSTGPVRASR